MKLVLQTLCVALFLVSCQKTLTPEKEVTTAIVASNANSPLKSHTLSLTTDYPIKPGEVPPFYFVKTLYSDHRVRTIKMLSRAYPIHRAFPKHALETIGTFTYAANIGDDKAGAPHLAFLKGTREVFEYYKNPNGTGARRSVKKWNLDLKFYLTSQGYCSQVKDLRFPVAGWLPQQVLLILYYPENPNAIEYMSERVRSADGQLLGANHVAANNDSYGNIITAGNIVAQGYNIPHPDYPARPAGNADQFEISYDYTAPAGTKNYSYIPSQNLISQDFSLVEVMQWLPKATYQRKTAGGRFRENPFLQFQDQFVYQDQVYKNFQFDANGNQKSLTYGDNILQKTTWDFQP